MTDRVKVLAWRLAIVAPTKLVKRLFFIRAVWKFVYVTLAENFHIFAIGVVAKIDIDIEEIKGVRSEEAAERNKDQ
jgi:hypothetical protein